MKITEARTAICLVSKIGQSRSATTSASGHFNLSSSSGLRQGQRGRRPCFDRIRVGIIGRLIATNRSGHTLIP